MKTLDNKQLLRQRLKQIKYRKSILTFLLRCRILVTDIATEEEGNIMTANLSVGGDTCLKSNKNFCPLRCNIFLKGVWKLLF